MFLSQESRKRLEATAKPLDSERWAQTGRPNNLNCISKIDAHTEKIMKQTLTEQKPNID